MGEGRRKSTNRKHRPKKPFFWMAIYFTFPFLNILRIVRMWDSHLPMSGPKKKSKDKNNFFRQEFWILLIFCTRVIWNQFVKFGNIYLPICRRLIIFLSNDLHYNSTEIIGIGINVCTCVNCYLIKVEIHQLINWV